MFRFLTLVVAVAVLAASYPVAMAQRDAGAKARGDYGAAFSRARSTTSPMVRSQPRVMPSPQVVSPQIAAMPFQADGIRTFSYEPQMFQAGDRVAVTGRDARLMIGTQQIGTLRPGQQFQVVSESNGWLGVSMDVQGQPVSGWVWQANVAPVGR